MTRQVTLMGAFAFKLSANASCGFISQVLTQWADVHKMVMTIVEARMGD